MKKEYREASTLKINRAQKKEAKERLHSLGITLEGFVAKAWDFVISSRAEDVYEFMKNKKTLILLMIVSGLLYLYLLLDNAREFSIVPLKMIDKIMK